MILAADGFHLCPTAQDPDTVVCFFCDLQALSLNPERERASEREMPREMPRDGLLEGECVLGIAKHNVTSITC